jgi:hypothetical protein
VARGCDSVQRPAGPGPHRGGGSHASRVSNAKEAAVFTVYCESCAAQTLIWPSQVDAIGNSDDGIVVRFHCSAGHRGVLVTGRTAEHEREAIPA